MFKPVHTLSVVIPCLNESDFISTTIKSVKNERGVLEIILADGGSTDDTREFGSKFGAVIVDSRKGRGIQINSGISESAGDVVLILHADCRILPGTMERIIHALNKNLNCIGGALGVNYGTNRLKYRLLAIINNIRASYGKISFGDQGQFFRREALDILGGFPRQMLMEDIEFSIRMKNRGKVAFIPDGIVASVRRWQDKGFIKNFTHVTVLFMTYLIKRRFFTGDPLKIDFYNRYYKNDKAS